jgi:tetratricopeptide (TPR) repeat protein
MLRVRVRFSRSDEGFSAEISRDGQEGIRKLSDNHHDCTPLSSAVPAVLTLVNNLAFVYREAGDNEQSRAAFDRALDAKLRIYGEDHWSTAVGYNNLANHLRLMGLPDEAIPNHQKAMEIVGRILESDDIRIQFLSVGYGQSLLEADRPAEAELILRVAYDRISGELGPDHRRSQSIAEDLVSAYTALGNDAEAARYQSLSQQL